MENKEYAKSSSIEGGPFSRIPNVVEREKRHQRSTLTTPRYSQIILNRIKEEATVAMKRRKLPRLNHKKVVDDRLVLEQKHDFNF